MELNIKVNFETNEELFERLQEALDEFEARPKKIFEQIGPRPLKIMRNDDHFEIEVKNTDQ